MTAPVARTSGGEPHLWDLVEGQVAARPNAPAIRDLHETYSYAQVRRRAINVAGALRAADVGRGDPVLVCTDRTARALVGHLGVVAAGATLVPVEPDGPVPRLERILAASGANVALTDEAGVAALSGQPVLVVDLNDAMAREDGGASQASADVAYLLFTSGSTGIPKGVRLTRRNLLAFLADAPRWESSGKDDVWASFSAFTFDVSMFELWRPICTGAQVFVVPRVAQLDASSLPDLIDAEGITSICQTPTAGRLFAVAASDHGPPSSLRRLLLAGERLDMAMLAPFAEAVRDDRLAVFNMYGPTETTIYATGYRVTANDIAYERRALIGRGLPHVRTRVAQPDGDGIGELWISGAGVAAGYCNDPELTAQRFVSSADGVSYRTADLVRDVGDGVLEFVGRASGYVKVRGYRIEPGEVAAALSSHPQVAQAVATATDQLDGGTAIVCAVVARPGTNPTEAELRKHAARHLPSYMRPARIVFFDSFPQLASSKLDERRVGLELVARLTPTGEATRRAGE